MRSRVTVAQHPVHPILVMFPIALLPLLVLLDLLAWFYDADALWTAGFWVALLGLATTAIAIVPGIVDLAAIPNATRAHRIAVFHFALGMFILALYAADVWIRWPINSIPNRTLVTSVDVLGAVAVSVQGWLGGELVYKHHIGVDAVEEGGEPVTLEAGPGMHVPPPRKTRRDRVG